MVDKNFSTTSPYTSSGQPKMFTAMQNSSQFQQRIGESVADYNKRMAQWREELDAKIKTENTNILQGLLNGVSPKISNDLYSLKNTSSAIDSLKFWQYCLGKYDSSLDNQIAMLRSRQQSVIQPEMEKLKKGEQDKQKLSLYESSSPNPFKPNDSSSLPDDQKEMRTGTQDILG